IVTVLEEDERLLSRAPYGEPQLGKRGLYEDTDTREQREALLWTLTMADGHSTFLDVAERSHLPTRELTEAKRRLERAGHVDRVGYDDDADQRPRPLPARRRAKGAGAPRDPWRRPHVRQGRRPVPGAGPRLHRARAGLLRLGRRRQPL